MLVVGWVITIVFITLLQVTAIRYFVGFLIAMHGGILFIILSKRRFIKNRVSIGPYYRVLNILLAFYLPILTYKLLSYVFHYEVHEPSLLWATMIITGIVSVLSLVTLYKKAVMLFRTTNET